MEPIEEEFELRTHPCPPPHMEGYYSCDWKGAWDELMKYTLRDLCKWEKQWIVWFCKLYNIPMPYSIIVTSTGVTDYGTSLYYHVKDNVFTSSKK